MTPLMFYGIILIISLVGGWLLNQWFLAPHPHPEPTAAQRKAKAERRVAEARVQIAQDYEETRKSLGPIIE